MPRRSSRAASTRSKPRSAKRHWLADDAFTIADLNLAAVLFRGPAFGLDPWPKLKDWHARCYARPGAKAAIAEREAKA